MVELQFVLVEVLVEVVEVPVVVEVVEVPVVFFTFLFRTTRCCQILDMLS